MNEDIKEKIGNLTDEDELRELREFADVRLQQVKEEKAFAKKEVLESKYKDKYLLIYSNACIMAYPKIVPSKIDDADDIKIVHVLDIEFKGQGFFRCHAKVIHIQYDTESSLVRHLTSSGFNEVKIQCFEDSQYDLRESDINEIVDKNTVNGIIAKAKTYQKEIMNNWDL